MKNRQNTKHQRGEWRLRSGNGMKWLAVNRVVRRA